MLIHSVTPIEYLQETPAAPVMRAVNISGGYLELESCEQGYKIARLVSTDPAAYLDKRFSPGSLYHLK